MESICKIYVDNQLKEVSPEEYINWRKENGIFYFVGPHKTKDSREIYTAFTANSAQSACFTTFEVFLNEDGMGDEEVIYETGSWPEARKLHKELLKVKTPKPVSFGMPEKQVGSNVNLNG